MRNVLVLFLVLCLSFGCGQNSEDVTPIANFYTEQSAAVDSTQSQENTRTLIHDFGVLVQPVTEAVECEFEIKNDSDTAWNLKQIVNTCSCTVADMTSPKIEPKTSEKILVKYKPIGDGSFDDTRKSLAIFQEESAPRFVLCVQSRVREPLTVKPQNISWTQVGENQTRQDHFEIQNYSEKDWEKVTIKEKPDWLRIDYKNVSPPQHETSMRQLWLADVVAETAGLKPGEHRGEIVLVADGIELKKQVPVVLQIQAAVSVVPAQFFFGKIKEGEIVTKTVKFIFSHDSIPQSKDEIRFEHNLGEHLRFDWIVSEGDFWELQASLTFEAKTFPDEPAVKIIFSDTKLPKLSLPVYVMLPTKESQ
ncbi:hypothetical protein FACS1894189_6090 [Planctomycetales bacterium]|nr:hypothetical protein FACS1894189_6090 [Planctomycetales bacterium]